MKNINKIGGLLVATTMFLGMTSVSASNLKDKIKISDESGVVKGFEVTYDEEKDINRVVVNVELSEKNLEKVLTQAPGNTASAAAKGAYYVTIDPGLGNGSFQKQFYNTTGDLLKDKEALASKLELATDAETKYSKVWVSAFSLDYKNSEGKWVSLTGGTSGSTPLLSQLSDASGIKESDFIFGQNLRAWKWSDAYKNNTLCGWSYVNEDGEKVTEYIEVSFTPEFPVSIIHNDILYPTFGYNTLKEATENVVDNYKKNTVIKVNKDLTITSNITIPEGVKLVLSEGVKLTIAQGVKVTINAAEDINAIESQIVNKENLVNAEGKQIFATATPENPDDKKEDNVKYEQFAKDKATGIIIENKNNIEMPKDVKMSIEKIIEGTETIAKIKDIIKTENFVAYDISFTYNDKEIVVLPEGTYRVTVPAALLKDLEGKAISAYYIQENGKIEVYEVTKNEAGDYTFETTHFSTYIFAETLNLNEKGEVVDTLDSAKSYLLAGSFALVTSLGAAIYLSTRKTR